MMPRGRAARATPLAEHPDEVYRVAADRDPPACVPALRRGARDAPDGDETFLRYYSLAGCTSVCARTPRSTPTRWTSVTAPGRSCSPCSAWSTTARTPARSRLPARHGVLFDPDRFTFLEGRPSAGGRQIHERIEPPLVPDGTIYRVLEKLLVLDGERLSYRALDVEQIGSVYETMMGFRLEQATGPLARDQGRRSHSAHRRRSTCEVLLGVAADKRGKWLQDDADRKLHRRSPPAVKNATTRRRAARSTLACQLTRPRRRTSSRPGAMVLAAEPGAAPVGLALHATVPDRADRAHGTPRPCSSALRATMARTPDGDPRPEGLRPGDGFGCVPRRSLPPARARRSSQPGPHTAIGRDIPADEDEVTLARRLVAQRCLYGVDRNPVAVDLAKMSLWLVTLAREHPLTFLDHALRHGDSLVGLTRRQIETFHWKAGAPSFAAIRIGGMSSASPSCAARSVEAGEETSDWALRDMWDEAQRELDEVRLFGDLAVAAFFAGASTGPRHEAVGVRRRHNAMEPLVITSRGSTRCATPSGHSRPSTGQSSSRRCSTGEAPGFDAIVGNPPFAGGRNLSADQGTVYPDWLIHLHDGSSWQRGSRRSLLPRALICYGPMERFGLIATNTIGQGDTRPPACAGSARTAERSTRHESGSNGLAVQRSLSASCTSQGHISQANDCWTGGRSTDHRVPGPRRRPRRSRAGLPPMPARAFKGASFWAWASRSTTVTPRGLRRPIAEMERLIAEDSRNAEAIFPYLGGQEVNESPTHMYHRYVINFGERNEEECRQLWPELMAIVEENVKPERITQGRQEVPADGQRVVEVLESPARNCSPRLQACNAFSSRSRRDASSLVRVPAVQPHLRAHTRRVPVHHAMRRSALFSPGLMRSGRDSLAHP